jgi:hypothetical protein
VRCDMERIGQPGQPAADHQIVDFNRHTLTF